MNHPRFEHTDVAAAVAAIEHGWLIGQRWFPGKGHAIGELDLVDAFPLDGRSVLSVVDVAFGDGAHRRITLPFVADPEARTLRPAEPGDGAWEALAIAAAEGRVIAAMARKGAGDASRSSVSAALVCRPAGRVGELLAVAQGGPQTGPSERALGVDQSNTSVVLDDSVVLKAFRRVEAGLEPDLELTAFLSEEVGFGAVPALAGSVELVTADEGVATIALLTEFIADAADGYEGTAETLTGWLLAPGEVTVEFATEDVEDLGLLTAALHGALVSRPRIEGFEPRPATREELRSWRATAEAGLNLAIDVSEGSVRERLRDVAPEISAHLTVHEAIADAPLVGRVHGDYHLGQVMRSEDGWRIIDFEGEPTRSLDERRRHASPLRDVASMLRSIHHVGLSAERRAIERRGGPLVTSGLDLDGWLRRSRERFLTAYRAGLHRAGTDIAIDDDLLLAFELEKACYEFVYAATYLPSWAEIALGGLEGLLAWTKETHPR